MLFAFVWWKVLILASIGYIIVSIWVVQKIELYSYKNKWFMWTKSNFCCASLMSVAFVWCTVLSIGYIIVAVWVLQNSRKLSFVLMLACHQFRNFFFRSLFCAFWSSFIIWEVGCLLVVLTSEYSYSPYINLETHMLSAISFYLFGECGLIVFLL